MTDKDISESAMEKIADYMEAIEHIEKRIKFYISCEYALKYLLMKHGSKIEVNNDDMRVIEKAELKLKLDEHKGKFNFELYFKTKESKSTH